jgi:hypothetical protein
MATALDLSGLGNFDPYSDPTALSYDGKNGYGGTNGFWLLWI